MWLLLAAIVLVPLCASCAGAHGARAGASDEPVEVRPFAEVQASEFSFEADPTDPHRGIFRVTTTEPMICAIVWGDDETFGRFNNSLSMNGTGIIQHDVVLPDVEPGVKYRYVVQGTTADGTLVPVAGRHVPHRRRRDAGVDRRPGDEPRPRRNGRRRVVGVLRRLRRRARSTATPRPSGRPTATATTASSPSTSVAAHHVTGVEFLTRSMADGTAITDTFTVGVDDADPVGPFPAGTVAEPHVVTLDAVGRQLRFDVADSTGGNVGAVEIRVFGDQT